MTVAGLDPGPVRGSRGVVLIPDVELSEVADRDFDMVVLPGGKEGSDRLAADERITQVLRRHQARGAWLAAICAAPAVLAKAGMLAGKRVTAYPGALDADRFGDVRVMASAVEVDGRIATSRGPGTAMEFALKLIELLNGAEARHAVEAPLQRH